MLGFINEHGQKSFANWGVLVFIFHFNNSQGHVS